MGEERPFRDNRRSSADSEEWGKNDADHVFMQPQLWYDQGTSRSSVEDWSAERGKLLSDNRERPAIP